MNVWVQYCGEIDSDSLDVANEIASESSSQKEAEDRVTALRCKEKCGKCYGCATADAIWDSVTFVVD
jgi:hypothetical protein